MIETIGTYLPRWGSPTTRIAGDDEDIVTMAVAAGRQALEASPEPALVSSVILISRDVPLIVGGNGAALLAGLSLSPHTEVRELIGGAPIALEAAATSAEGTLVIGSDIAGGAGAAAVLIGHSGASATFTGRTNRSLPVTSRLLDGGLRDYRDPRLLRERGYGESLERLHLEGPVAAVAGVGPKDAAGLVGSTTPALPTTGASSALFALAALVSVRSNGMIVAVEQATVAVITLGEGNVVVRRDEDAPTQPVQLKAGSEADISLSLAAYDRAFEDKLRFEASACPECGTLAYPRRYRCISCGSEGPSESVPLPREAEVYSLATIHVPVPGLATPYTVVLVNLGETGVRLLGRLTAAAPGSVSIGDRGRMVFRRVAVRMGIPDYGYSFRPDLEKVA